MNLTLGDIATIVGISTTLFGAAMLVLKALLAREFVSRADLGQLGGQMTSLRGEVAQLRERMASVITHNDLGTLFDRIGGMEREQARVGERVEGMRETMTRVDRRLESMVAAQLEIERKPQSRRSTPA